MRSVVLLAFTTVFLLNCSESQSAEPVKIGQPLLCHGCVAVVKELHKLLKDSSGSKKTVSKSFERLCQINNFVSYTFSPPKMIKACTYFVDNHKSDMIPHLIDYYKKYKTADNLQLQEKICDHVINACEGTRRPTKESEMKPHGFTAEDANRKLQDAAQKGFKPIEAPLEDEQRMQIQTPAMYKNVLTTPMTPMPKEEL